MYKRFNFTLDSIIYSCESDGKDDILINLPKGIPNEVCTFKSEHTGERSTVLIPTDQIKIKLYLTVKSDKAPKLVIHCDKRSMVSYASTTDLEPNATNVLTFTTYDGGAKWLFDNQFYDKEGNSSFGITDVNGDKGPHIVLDASKIHMSGSKGPTILDEMVSLKQSLSTMGTVIKSEVVDDVVKILPDKIEMVIQDTKIIAPKI